jgi:DNA processing protein
MAVATRTKELEWRVAAALSYRFSPDELAALIARFGGVSLAASVAQADLGAFGLNMPAKLGHARRLLDEGAVDKEIEACSDAGIALITPGTAGFPELLTKAPPPPALLWVRGEITEADGLALAIVGSRSASIYGAKQAARFAALMAARQITVISGLARGIDTAAHRGALEAGGRTIAITGSGLGNLYPPENAELALDIAQNGAVISEFPLATAALPRNFPQRNRIIAGMSLGVLVAQADLQSGSLITARLAGDYGREVFAVPGKVDNDEHRGCHRLIKDGAKLAEDLADILEEVSAFRVLDEELPKERRANTRLPALPLAGATAAETAVLRSLAPSEPVNVEELVAKLGLPAQEIAAALLTLEMRGAVRQFPGRNYVLG